MSSVVNEELGLKIDYDENVINQLTEIALKHYPNEIGGFILGKYAEENKKAIIIECVVATNYKNSPISFKHKVDYETKEFFVRKFNEDNLHYIGEWHTHPDSNSRYSSTDFNALQRVANNNTSNIENPILLILGFSKKGLNDYSFYVIEKNKISKYG
ncbi:Mov34/MPN/PAD-1 family protein [uncultured Psychroserpens sp.]|uniref:Mov34/MPN/PAD-1 family protein n=1 Tax=uncultured Psychroserpens sp. TaxID=255436 RepID=UPI00261421E3|nr:Mov34/MPN/PAD-1 family protein [uncultured Psychroserpens sp.]